ncbi:MAG: hypothetical protein ACYS1A_04220 [Planctomycetota bacterium]|jgi:hypothetical protein
MAENQEQKWAALKSLETYLRRLAEIEVPKTLKAKLLAAIPNKQTTVISKRPVWWLPGAWGFGATAAAILVLALIFVTNYGPSGPSQLMIADINDKPTYRILADQNSTYTGDTEPCGLQWSIVNQNEPAQRY